MGRLAISHRDLDVYQRGFEAAMTIFLLSKGFPREELYSLVDQIRRASRSLCANLAEAWRKRRYQAAFISKLSDAEAEAAETQVWLEFAVRCEYLEKSKARELYTTYNGILRTIVGMINNPQTWILPAPARARRVNDARE